MSDIEQFRIETRAWLEANCPPSMRARVVEESDHFWGGRTPAFASDDQKIWFERMAERGWTVPRWPTEYGGAALPEQEAAVLREEMHALGCRLPLSSMGIWMLSHALFKYGTPEQKRRFLPDIAKGRIRWAQGYSEPGAGSDLVSLQCRAEDRGEHWLVNGQKIWTSYADKADWIFCLVRTDPADRYRGISVLMMDMRTPGISTRPIRLISGASPFCETFFDDVKVPKDQLLGELNRGWDVAKHILLHERETIGELLGGSDYQALGTALAERWGPIHDPILRARVALFDVDALAFAAMSEKFAEEAKAGRAHPAQASMMKYASSELGKARYELIMAVAGSEGLVWNAAANGSPADPRQWLRSKGYSIEGGTSEVQLNVIAKRILDLPAA